MTDSKSTERRSVDPVLRALGRLDEKVDRVLAGFPDGDPDGHRRFHEVMIRKAEAREKFWNDMSAKLIERGVWATLMALVGAALYTIRETLHR